MKKPKCSDGSTSEMISVAVSSLHVKAARKFAETCLLD